MTDEELYNFVLKFFSDANKDYVVDPILTGEITTIGQVNSPCKHCLNNPNNGGSGVCHCTLGNPVVY